MARMRSLKPEFWQDEELACQLTRDERMLYIGLWNLADEHARLRGDPRYIKGQLFPYDDDITPADIDKMLGRLADLHKVHQYRAGIGRYLFLPNLARHQRLESDKVPSRLPGPDDDERGETPPVPGADESECGADESAPGASSLPLKHVAGGMEHVAGGMEGAGGPARDPRRQIPDAEGLHEIPDDFAPTAAMLRWADEHYPGLDLAEETAQFCRHWRGEGRRKKSWPDAWQKWIADSHKRKHLPNVRAPASGTSRHQQETDEMFDRAMERARVREAREAAANAPHGNGDVHPLPAGDLPPPED